MTWDIGAFQTPAAAPADPTALSVTSPGNSTKLDLAWTDNSADESGFQIERALSGAGPFSLITTTAADVTAFQDTGLDPNTEYFYRVRAVNGFGGSGFSNVDSETTPAVPEDIKTVIPAGGGDYLTLQSWEAAEDRNITDDGGGADVIAVASCFGGDLHGANQTLTVAGWTVDRFHYIEIRNDPGNHQDGTPWDGTGPFVNEGGGFSQILWTVNQDFFRVKGIQLTCRIPSGRVVLINSNNPNGHYRFEECLLADDAKFVGHPGIPFILDFLSPGGSPATQGCGGSGPDGPNLIRNCVLYTDQGEGTTVTTHSGPTSVITPNGDLTNVTIHNCTFIQFLSFGTIGNNGLSAHLIQSTGTITEQNNYFNVVGATTVYDTVSTGPINKGVNTATSNTEAVTVALQSIAPSFSTFQGPSNPRSLIDLNLPSNSPLSGAGADLSGSGVLLDNAGRSRFVPYDIGAYITAPTTAPANPTNLIATPVSQTQIDLSWTDNASNEEGYEVHRSTTGIGGPYTLLTTLPSGSTAYSDMGLPIGTEFCYRVRATAGALGVAVEAGYDMEELSGTRFDATPNNNDLSESTNVPPIGVRAGSAGLAPNFVSSQLEKLTRASTASLTFGDEDMTIVCFALIDIQINQAFVAKWGSVNTEYLLRYLGSNAVEFFISSDGSTTAATATSTFGALTTGQYHFIVADHDSVGNTIGVEINETGRDSAAVSTGIFSGSQNFEVGGRDAVRFMDGGIDQLFVYRRLLTAFEKTALRNGGNGLPFAQLNFAGVSGFTNDACATTLTPVQTNPQVDNVLVESAGWREGKFSGSVSARAAAGNVSGYFRQNIQPTDDSSSDSPLGSPGGNSDDLTTRRVRNYYTIPPANWWQQYRLRMNMAESALNRKEDGFRYYLRLYKHLQTLRLDGPCVTQGDLLGRSFIHPNNPSADEDIRWPGVVNLNALQLQFRWLPNFGCADILDTDLELARFEIDVNNFLSLKILAGDPDQREYNQHDIHGPHEPTLRLSKTRLGSEVAFVDLVTYWGYDLREPSLERLDDVLLLTIQHNTVGLSLRVDKYGGFGERRTADDLTAFAGNGLGDIIYNGSGYYGPPVLVDENSDREKDGVRRRVRSSRPDLARRFFTQERNMVATGERDTTNGQRVEDQPFLLEEDFNRSDDANLGDSWDIIRQTGNGFNIVSNKASCTDDGFERWDAAPKHRDYTIEADVSVLSNADLVGVIGRYPNEFFNSDFASVKTVGGGIGLELVQLTASSAELRLHAWWLDVRGLTYDTQALSSYTAGVEYRMRLTMNGSTITGTIAEIGTGTVLATVNATSTLFPKPGRIVIYGEAPTDPVTINRIVAEPNFVTDLT